MARDVDVREVLASLEDIDFPASKDELLQEARTEGASEEVLAALRSIPREEYGNRQDVARSVPTEPDSDIPHSRAQQAEQARRGGKPGQSQHLRDVPKPPVEEELDR